MENLELLKNLMVMAAIDGKLADEEMELLLDRAKQWGIVEDDFKATLEYAGDPDAALTLPESKSQRLQLLSDLVRVMAADGELAELEKNLFALAAAHMDISDAELDRILDELG